MSLVHVCNPDGPQIRSATGVIFKSVSGGSILSRMAHFPQLTKTRALRMRVPSNESANFKLGGMQVVATLQKLSLTGGLAEFRTPVGEATLAEVTLNTASGPITALVELLQAPKKGSPCRPFRFIALDDHDFQVLAATLQTMRRQGLAE